MIKQELKKFIASFLLTNIYLVIYNCALFENSLFDSIKAVFSISDFETLLFSFVIYFLAYLAFNLVYLIFRLFLSKYSLKYSPLLVTTTTILLFILLFILNDYSISNRINPDEISRYFVSHNNGMSEIDSSNFVQYSWERKYIELRDEECLVYEEIYFYSNNSFIINGSRIKGDRFYWIRILFNDYEYYDIEGIYEYTNGTFSNDSDYKFYSIQIRDSKLYLNTALLDKSG